MSDHEYAVDHEYGDVEDYDVEDHAPEFDDTVGEGDEPVAGPGTVPGQELSEQLDATVRKEIGGQLAAAARTIAEGVVEELLTPRRTALVRAAAIAEAEIALSPPPEPEPEPEPETFYADVGAFVDGYIAELYRREVSARGIQSTRRWCPRWWTHGEAVGRLEALWRSWEEMRHGKGSEMAGWWIRYCDPMMAALFDPEGPFSSCSVEAGHHGKPGLPRLPLTPAPERLFEDGYTPAADAEQVVSSSLELPRASVGRSRVVKVFPG